MKIYTGLFVVGAGVNIGGTTDPGVGNVQLAGYLNVGTAPPVVPDPTYVGIMIAGATSILSDAATVAGSRSFLVASNAIIAAGAWTRLVSGPVFGWYHNVNSGFVWRAAPTGAAGAFTWTNLMQLWPSGGLNIGGTTDPGAGNLIVTGGIVSRLSINAAAGAGSIVELHPNGVTTLNTGLQMYAGLSDSGLWQWGNLPILFATNNTERMRLGAGLNIGDVVDPGVGNLGLGLTSVPSAPDSTYRHLLWNSASIMAFATNSTNGAFVLSNNAFFGGGQYRYMADAILASQYYQLQGYHAWRTSGAGTGAAGTIIPWTQVMKLYASGGLSLGGSTDPGAGNLAVAGNIIGLTTVVVAVAYSGSITINAALGNIFEIAITNATAFTVNAPTNPSKGQEIVIRFKNTTAATSGNITWNVIFKHSTAIINVTAAFSAIDRYYYDGTSWIQIIPPTTAPN